MFNLLGYTISGIVPLEPEVASEFLRKEQDSQRLKIYSFSSTAFNATSDPEFTVISRVHA